MSTTTAKALHETPFIRLLCSEARAVILDSMAAAAEKHGEAPSAPPMTVAASHKRFALLAASEVLTVCNQMSYAAQLLSGYRSRPSADDYPITRHDYMIYQIENHILRTGMLHDRALQLVNVVFDLGIPQRDCRSSVITENFHVRSTPTCEALKTLHNVLKPYQAERNTISHRESYADDDLYYVELQSTFQKSATTDDELLELANNIAKPVADAFVKERRAKMQAANESSFDQVAVLFTSLCDPYVRTLSRLKTSG